MNSESLKATLVAILLWALVVSVCQLARYSCHNRTRRQNHSGLRLLRLTPLMGVIRLRKRVMSLWLLGVDNNCDANSTDDFAKDTLFDLSEVFPNRSRGNSDSLTDIL